MKRRNVIWGSAVLLIATLFIVYKTGVFDYKPNIKSSAAVLMDMNTGHIWMDVNGDASMPPASMSKMMTELIVLDRISEGKSRWEERVPISLYASSVGGVTLSLYHGETYTVRELFQGIAVYSANDAAVALAEHIAGSENSFVVMMNNKARSLGLSPRSSFANASGLSGKDLGPNRPPGYVTGETMLTAKDAARLAMALIHTHPEVLNTSSLTQMKLTGKGLYVSNMNSMLPEMGGAYAYEGNDGLKTGFDSRTGYCFAGTAHRDGQRLVAVVMGAKTNQERFEETAKLFDYGFYLSMSWESRVKHILYKL
ncbi:D-alanyl-D-alanine carboxypeptidase family protein [Paenibacillus wynnii]|uniref:Peptidase M15 n=1 Tax=Paenibacillus wynnii TaxID=268407 RepID=A0A098MEP2_9BACL|nr:D-alanyl-D-alanine carboxypeptidase family protein [Paenibacillus wynnii]KGE20007.1 peptidase M15 [Paenibacillus wynnii]